MTNKILNHKHSAGIEAEIGGFTSESRCPFIGLKYDPATSHGYPHLHNMCFRHEQPDTISLKVQSHFCLSGAHESCAVFQQLEPGAQEKTQKKVRIGTKKAVPSLALALLFILIISAALIWWPMPWTSIEDNTGQAAPLNKITTQDDSSAADSAPAVTPAAEDQQDKATDAVAPVGEIGTQDKQSPQDSPAPAATSDGETPQDQEPGGFRVHSYK